MQATRSNVTPAPYPTKRKIVGMEPTLPTIRDPSVTTNKNEERITPSNQPQLKLSMNQNTNSAAPALRGNSRREGVFNRGSPHHTQQWHHNRMQWNTNGRHAIATIKRHNTKNYQHKEYPDWIKDPEDQYMTTRQPLPKLDQERVNVSNKDYRCDPWTSQTFTTSHPSFSNNNSLHHRQIKIQTTVPSNHRNKRPR